MIEWNEFREQASALVHKGIAPDVERRSGLQQILQIVNEPAFHAMVGWQLYNVYNRHQQSVRYIGTRLLWDLPKDNQRFITPVARITQMRLSQLGLLAPDLQQAQIDLTADQASGIIDRLNALTIPLTIRKNYFGTDGETWKMTIGDHWTGATFHWWGTAPKNGRL